jgi:hypothetical protein
MAKWWRTLSQDKRWLIGSVLTLWVVQIVYVVSPIDLLPDFIPFIGWLDDALMLVVTTTFTGFAVRRLHRQGSFAGLLPDAFRPETSETGAVVPNGQERDREDPHGIPGYRPMTPEELRSL